MSRPASETVRGDLAREAVARAIKFCRRCGMDTLPLRIVQRLLQGGTAAITLAEVPEVIAFKDNLYIGIFTRKGRLDMAAQLLADGSLDRVCLVLDGPDHLSSMYCRGNVWVPVFSYRLFREAPMLTLESAGPITCKEAQVLRRFRLFFGNERYRPNLEAARALLGCHRSGYLERISSLPLSQILVLVVLARHGSMSVRSLQRSWERITGIRRDLRPDIDELAGLGYIRIDGANVMSC